MYCIYTAAARTSTARGSTASARSILPAKKKLRNSACIILYDVFLAGGGFSRLDVRARLLLLLCVGEIVCTRVCGIEGSFFLRIVRGMKIV